MPGLIRLGGLWPLAFVVMGRSKKSVPGNWQAVADAIQARMAERGLNQAKLIALTSLSKSTVRGLATNSEQRDRNVPTLRGMSTALGWHEDHLAAIRDNKKPPQPGQRVAEPNDDDVPERPGSIEYKLDQMSEQLDKLTAKVDSLVARLDKIEPAVMAVVPALWNAVRGTRPRPLGR
jgi:hypothetical protein